MSFARQNRFGGGSYTVLVVPKIRRSSCPANLSLAPEASKVFRRQPNIPRVSVQPAYIQTSAVLLSLLMLNGNGLLARGLERLRHLKISGKISAEQYDELTTVIHLVYKPS
jgi:hypothetical protein